MQLSATLSDVFSVFDIEERLRCFGVSDFRTLLELRQIIGVACSFVPAFGLLRFLAHSHLPRL